MLSVVIPAFNEEKTIAQCIESLIIQTTNEPYEVIVVDNASTDRTFEIASKYKNKLDLKVIKESKKGRGAARFEGFKKAKGNIILSFDSDSVAPKNWIAKMILPFENKKIIAVTGTGRIEDCPPRTNIGFNILQPASMVAFRLLFRHFWLTGFNFAIRAETYEQSGGFNPDLKSNEDVDLALRVSKLGKIKFITQPQITVSGRRVKKGLIKGMYSYVPGFVSQFVFKKPIDLNDIR